MAERTVISDIGVTPPIVSPVEGVNPLEGVGNIVQTMLSAKAGRDKAAADALEIEQERIAAQAALDFNTERAEFMALGETLAKTPTFTDVGTTGDASVAEGQAKLEAIKKRYNQLLNQFGTTARAQLYLGSKLKPMLDSGAITADQMREAFGSEPLKRAGIEEGEFGVTSGVLIALQNQGEEATPENVKRQTAITNKIAVYDEQIKLGNATFGDSVDALPSRVHAVLANPTIGAELTGLPMDGMPSIVSLIQEAENTGVIPQSKVDVFNSYYAQLSDRSTLNMLMARDMRTSGGKWTEAQKKQWVETAKTELDYWYKAINDKNIHTRMAEFQKLNNNLWIAGLGGTEGVRLLEASGGDVSALSGMFEVYKNNPAIGEALASQLNISPSEIGTDKFMQRVGEVYGAFINGRVHPSLLSDPRSKIYAQYFLGIKDVDVNAAATQGAFDVVLSAMDKGDFGDATALLNQPAVKALPDDEKLPFIQKAQAQGARISNFKGATEFTLLPDGRIGIVQSPLKMGVMGDVGLEPGTEGSQLDMASVNAYYDMLKRVPFLAPVKKQMDDKWFGGKKKDSEIIIPPTPSPISSDSSPAKQAEERFKKAWRTFRRTATEPTPEQVREFLNNQAFGARHEGQNLINALKDMTLRQRLEYIIDNNIQPSDVGAEQWTPGVEQQLEKVRRERATAN